ncbi:MAG: hypothetical protein ACFFAN_17555 [Promethearchaeota archaeon]
MIKESESIKKESRDKLGIYVTFNGLPIYSLTNEPGDDKAVLISSFLHTIDIIARETRKKIGRKADFLGFSVINEIDVNVMEIVIENDDDDKYMGRLFIETSYGKISINRSPIAALLDASKKTISKIINKELNQYIQPKKIAEYFNEQLKSRGYTPEKLMIELGHFKVSKIQLSKYLPISLFSIEGKKGGESEENIESKYKVKEVGNYNVSKFKTNPVKDEDDKLTFDSGLIIGLAEALKSYQSASDIENGVVLLRFKDYTLEVFFKKDGMPIIGVLIKGSGTPDEMFRYNKDIRNLEK